MNKYFNLIIASCVTALLFGGCSRQGGQQKHNFLFIIIDDQNDMIGALGNGQSTTPNLDRLASQSTLFTHAYCSAPACGPSRASLLTGLLPSTTGVYYNSQPNEKGTVALSGAVTLPEHFKNNGFLTGIYGKIFHEKDNMQHAALCTPGYFTPHLGFWANIPDTSVVSLTDFRHEGGSNFAWGAVPDDWENDTRKLIDTENTDKVIKVLQEKHDAPFFLALGLLRPHLPWIVPQRFFDAYPLESISIPPGFMEGDLDDLPECAVWMAREVPGHNIGESNVHEAITTSDKWMEAIRAYKASTSYADHQLGRVLDALESSPYADNTVIILCCDHGYHVGEKEHWTKFGLWEKANRVPFMISVPGGEAQICTSPVSLLDLYPTAVALAGINPPESHILEGVDLSFLVDDPAASRGRPVLSTYGYQCHSLRNERYRYIRYRNGEEELYDHAGDPYEWYNLAKDQKYASIKMEMKAQLPEINIPESDAGANLGWVPQVFAEGYVYERK